MRLSIRLLLPCIFLVFSTSIITESKAPQRASRIVARFVALGASYSRPVGSGRVRLVLRDMTFEKRTNSKGWLVMNVPCNTEGYISYGDTLQFQTEIMVQCSRKPVGLGVFDWTYGDRMGDDMDHPDGCYSCE
jgi:hypothetical protein